MPHAPGSFLETGNALGSSSGVSHQEASVHSPLLQFRSLGHKSELRALSIQGLGPSLKVLEVPPWDG